MNIALNAANETAYWLTLLYDSDFIDKNVFKNMKDKNVEILRLLISIVKGTKENLKRH